MLLKLSVGVCLANPRVILFTILLTSNLLWAQQTTNDVLSACLLKLSQISAINNSTVWPNYGCYESTSYLNSSVKTEASESEAQSAVKVDGVEKQVAQKNTNETQTAPSKLNSMPIIIGEEVLLFSSDENPVKKVTSLGCVTGEISIVEKCYPSVIDELRSGKTTIDQMKARVPYRFDIKGQGGSTVEDRRAFEFHHENFARQDVGLTIFDGFHNSAKADSYATEIVFFPRSQVPSYQVKKDEIEVTLANGEKMIFDSKSGKIKSGVLTESSIQKGKPGTFKYSGKNIMIQATGLDGHSKSYLSTAKTATITKDGKSCEVAFEKLWSRPKGDQAVHFNFSTDESFYNWLEKDSKCFK